MAAKPLEDRPARAGGLRRELGVVEAIALSIAIMAPTAAMALNGTAVAGLIGRAVPLAFVVATVGVLFVSYGIVRLTTHFNSAGSVFALVGHTLGPRAGFFAGWAIFGSYLCFAVASLAQVGLFGDAFLSSIDSATPDRIVLTLGGACLALALVYRKIRFSTRAMFAAEAVSVTLILVLVAAIFGKLAAGTAPHDAKLTLDVFWPADGISLSAVATATVFGFLSFAGFEGAAALGEETDNPSRNIPRAIGGAAVGAGIFYIVVMASQSLGFGASSEGAAAFAASEAPLGDLSNAYVGGSMASLIDLGACISAFVAAVGCITGASRLLFSLTRDAFGAQRFVRTSGKGAPVGPLAVVGVVAVVGVSGLRLGDASAVNAFFYPGTLGVLVLLVTYSVTNLGAIRYLFFDGQARAPRRELAIPCVALCILGYVLYKNTDPRGLEYPYTIFPLIALGWLLVGLVVMLGRPQAAARIGRSLVADGSKEPPAARALR